ncbi:hypothetical protein L0Z65_13070 [Phaeobacter sp. BS52]|uniref:hypothetical protein n=1 Tax=Phaeobacter sp. BS52 TaxID=2907241 RepID=UPI00386C6CEC
MSRVNTLQALFKRYRRPGDIVFAWIILIVALLLLAQLYEQTAWRKGGPLFAQPRFWLSGFPNRHGRVCGIASVGFGPI